MWIARDRNGDLYLYEEKPLKGTEAWGITLYLYRSRINRHFFPEVKWEDDEPRELVLKEGGEG